MISYNRVLFFVVLMLCICSSQNVQSEVREPLPCLNREFSIVVHIVRDSLGAPGIGEGAITNDVDALHTYFQQICVSFEICEFRYIDNYNYDVYHSALESDQMIAAYHVANRINIFYVQEIINPEDAAGLATLGGIGNMNGGALWITKGGGAGTLTHEMGHYFGLSHTFEGNGIELVDGSNCETEGDGICDTPADPYNPDTDSASDVVSNCIYTGTQTDANGEYYSPDVGNIMSYYGCACEFTYGQYQLMANTYLNSDPKMW